MKQDILSIPKRPLIKNRIYQRAIIAALGSEGIKEQSIAIFTSVHPKTVRRWICRVFSSHVQMHPSHSVIHYIMDNISSHYHNDFCHTVAKLSDVPYTPLKTGSERRQWLQSQHKRIVIHFVPFYASWLNMVVCYLRMSIGILFDN